MFEVLHILGVLDLLYESCHNKLICFKNSLYDAHKSVCSAPVFRLLNILEKNQRTVCLLLPR